MGNEFLGTGNDDGVIMGRDTTVDKIGFYGLATAIIQPTSASQAAAATTASTKTTTTWGFTTSTQAQAILTLVNRLRTDLVGLGLVKGS